MQIIPTTESNPLQEKLIETFADAAKCLSPASFSMPRWIVPSGWLQHAPFAFWLIEKARPGTIVELGTHSGLSYLTFCQAAQELGLGATCCAIDTWTGDELNGLPSEDIFSRLKEYHGTHYSGFSKLVRSDFTNALDSFPQASIDLLHICSQHFYEDASDVFHSWLPKLSKSAVLLIHNTLEHNNEFGVARLWHELTARYPSFEFNHGHGLGVLAVGHEMPSALKPLFFATEASRDVIRQVYARLGLSVADRLDLSTLQQKLALGDETLAQLESELEARAAAFHGLQTEIEGLRSAITAFRANEVAALQAEIDERDRRLMTHKSRIVLLENELAEKAAEASVLRTDLEAHREAEAALSARLVEESEQVTVYRTDNEALQNEIEEARQELVRSVDISTLLNERLRVMESTLPEANQQLERLLNRSKFLEERLNAMESSTSWGLTKPFRSLSDFTQQLAKRMRS